MHVRVDTSLDGIDEGEIGNAWAWLRWLFLIGFNLFAGRFLSRSSVCCLALKMQEMQSKGRFLSLLGTFVYKCF